MYVIPYIDINVNLSCNEYPNNIKTTIGKLKHELTVDSIIDKLHKNQTFVDFIKSNKNLIIPITSDFYSEEIAKIFDIFGGTYNVIVDDIEYIIKIYFYKIKNIELITKRIILKFNTIFRYDYFIKNNILNMTWHYYTLNVNFINNLSSNRFLDLSFDSQYTMTKLFNHQKNNISRMLRIHHNPTIITISDNMPIYFENDLIFDMTTNQFINHVDIPTYNVFSGMVIDEPGTGKTLQFILYILETNLKSLIVVPNDNIKSNWEREFKKHIHPEHQIPFDILTFIELEMIIQTNPNFLNNNQYQIIGIDEIHNLYRNFKCSPIFDKIITSNIKHRWGITGTPFVSDLSLFHIVKFLTGHNFKNERVVNNPSIQKQFIDLFLKNCKDDMLDDYVWPQLNIHDIKIQLDIIQQNLYNTEKMLNNTLNLRKLVCEINLMFNQHDFKTPVELKQYIIEHYTQLYDIEVAKLEDLKARLQNIKDHRENFEENEYKMRIHHFTELVENKNIDVKKHFKAKEYFINSIEGIDKILSNTEEETSPPTATATSTATATEGESDFCKICWGSYNTPVTYIKTCGHYFCKLCLDSWTRNSSQKGCPLCREEITDENVIHVSELSDINSSSKIHELLEIISTDDQKYIIFTQFNSVISKIENILIRNNISATTLDKYTDQQILILSSEKNAEGIDLSNFDKMIIFEPFENNIYNDQVEKQLIARIHRVGRVKPVDVYRFITEGTIEEEIYSKFK
jgi:SNF2 family DNA or RNA helicase